MRIGALEAGGTKMVLTVSDESMRILGRETLPTRTPEETVPGILRFFRDQGIDALGIGSFGPLDLNPSSSAYGSITETPKLAWRHYPLLKTLREALGVPAALDTDVNAAALCEALMGAAKGLNTCVYLTVGTGIGAGVMCNGGLVHGLMHPEWGHMLLAPHPADPMPEGICPYHKGCLEGLASGPSLEKRWGVPGQALGEDHIGWEIEAHYLAQFCVSALLAISAERIILGGGVMAQRHLFPRIRRETQRLLNGYLPCVRELDSLIVPPARYPDSGMLGALILGKRALEAEKTKNEE
ncbi:MAG: ROK family protein [Clostridiales bacterium]|nr:ROK family protein [Clostridiales bacterium]